jgi:hypothetical protein
MMSKILFTLVALAASAAATKQFNAFVCDHQNKCVSLQEFSHRQLTWICIQPTKLDMSIQGLDLLLFLQQAGTGRCWRNWPTFCYWRPMGLANEQPSLQGRPVCCQYLLIWRLLPFWSIHTFCHWNHQL